VIFGGVGAGLYGMLIFVVLAVFIAGLMVGRTPEYLGKKIEAYDVKLVMLVLMVLSATILGFTAWACVSDWGQAGPQQRRPARLQRDPLRLQLGVGNNGSAFAGLTAARPTATPLGHDARPRDALRPLPHDRADPGPRRQPRLKKLIPASAGTFKTEGITFVVLLIGTVLLVGALTFLPALAMGPIVEHFLMGAGTLF
jgi:potassium-transporting ATPase potassium-binding subunit